MAANFVKPENALKRAEGFVFILFLFYSLLESCCCVRDGGGMFVSFRQKDF